MTHKVIFNTSAFAREQGLERNALLRYINKREATNEFTRNIEQLVEETKVKDLFRSNYIKVNLHDRDLLVRGYDEGVAVGLDEGYSAGVEEGYNTGVAEGESRGALQKALEAARNMIIDNLPLEVISRYTGLPLSTVQQLLSECR